MTRKEFERRMRKLKADKGWLSWQGPHTCDAVKSCLGPLALEQYDALLSSDRTPWVSVNEMREHPITGSLHMARDYRANAILMFEQTVLAFEMYKEW